MSNDVISMLMNTPCNGDQARVFAAAKAEIERLNEALKTAQYRGMVDERISYRGYSYGMRSMSGIADLRRAIERDGRA